MMIVIVRRNPFDPWRLCFRERPAERSERTAGSQPEGYERGRCPDPRAQCAASWARRVRSIPRSIDVSGLIALFSVW